MAARPCVSYAVIQRSTLTPSVTVPPNVATGVPFKLEASLRTSNGTTDFLPSDLPEPVQMEAIVDGQTFLFATTEPSGDEKKDDGRFTTMLICRQHLGRWLHCGSQVRKRNSFLDRTVKVTVNAQGFFRYNGGPVNIDFGSLRAGQSVCKALVFDAEQQGAIPFDASGEDTQWPLHLQFELRGAGKRSAVGGAPIPLLLQDSKEICLVTDRDAESSQSHGQSWVNLAVNGRQEMESTVELRLSWSVRSLTFWEKWGWLILLILAVLLVAIIVYGYIKPYRFATGLALCYAPAMDELDDQTPQPIRVWRGVRIGFYRDARACLHDTFRINGKVKGAVSILQAGPRRSVIVKPGSSRPLYREVGVGEWDQVPPTGRRAGQGEVYRVGESGPYFRLSMRM